VARIPFFTRHIPHSYMRRVAGLNVAQVAVLVGGPDWPTAVLCGILGLSQIKILIGTTPVLIPIILCVLSGGSMVKQAETAVRVLNPKP
jgi:hypothetical protein